MLLLGSPAPVTTLQRNSVIVFAILLLCQASSHASVVLWETDFGTWTKLDGDSVNSGSNPWLTSSSEADQFVMDGDSVVIQAQPGQSLSNAQPLAITPTGGKVCLELLLRTDSPSTLSLTASYGCFTAPGGTLAQGTLNLPGIDSPNYAWESFEWDSSGMTPSLAGDMPTDLQFFLTSIDNPLNLAAARVTFEPAAAPEPGRTILTFLGITAMATRRKRR